MASQDSEKGLEKVPERITDFDGPDDAENAQNWPAYKRYYHAMIISGVSLVGTMASSSISPAIDIYSEEFGVSTEIGVLAYSIYVLGLALGAPFSAPLSETIGRRNVIWASMPFYAIFILGSGFSQNAATLCVLRLLAGIAGAPSLSLGSAYISDMFAPEHRAVPMVFFVMSPMLGPAIAPLVGGAVTQQLNWRWTAWVTLFFTIVLFFLPAPLLKEAYKKRILQARARRLGVKGPPNIWEGKPWSQTILIFAKSSLSRPLHMFFTEPVVTAFVLYVSFNFSLLYLFFAAFQVVYQEYYGFNLVEVGLTFLGVGVGVVFGGAICLTFHFYHYLPQVRRPKDSSLEAKTTSKVPPEQRLPMAMLGGPMITSGLFLFGWTTAYRVHWIAPVIGEALFGCGNLLVFMSSTTFIMDVYGPLYGASAMAANSLMRYLFGFSFPLFSLQLFSLGPQWACTLLGCLSILGAAVPWVLFRWGPRLRAKTKYPIGY